MRLTPRGEFLLQIAVLTGLVGAMWFAAVLGQVWGGAA